MDRSNTDLMLYAQQTRTKDFGKIGVIVQQSVLTSRSISRTNRSDIEHYRAFTSSICDRGSLDHASEAFAAQYLGSLETYLIHLRSLDQTRDMQDLVTAVDSYLDVIREDHDRTAL